MGYFGNFIASVIDTEQKAGKETTAASMAARMGMRPSMMSRFLNDPKRHGVHPKTLEKMCKGIGDDPSVRAQLRIAYLKDQVGTGEDAGLVRIDVIRARRITQGNAERPFLDYRGLGTLAARLGLNESTLCALSKIIKASARSNRFRRYVRNLSEIADHHVLTN
jgi:DNA-binding Xre family transcriptional regulator